MVFGHHPTLIGVADQIDDIFITKIKKSGVVIIECHTDSWINFIYSGNLILNISVKDVNKENDEEQ